MERRELFKKSMLAAGAGFASLSGSLALAQAQNDKKGYAAQPDMLKGQENADFNPKEAHAYATGIQAFEYGFPLVYFANLMWEWAKNPNSALKPINAWITAKDFVATSNYRYGGSFNTDTVYTAAFTDLRKGPMVLSTLDPEGHYFATQLSDLYTNNFAYISKRSGGKLWGIVAHPPRECTYLWASQDQNGERLNSKGVYELYMRKDQFPKVEAFWSFTMYQDFNLVVNDINRWAIRENSKHLKYEADGSLRIYIQSERPAEDKVSNWLPSPKTGNFNLTMRNYMPSVEIIEQRYDPPVLKRLA
jgi:hypothetical protein